MGMIVVSVLLSTPDCSTWREDGFGNRCYEVCDNLVTN